MTLSRVIFSFRPLYSFGIKCKTSVMSAFFFPQLTCILSYSLYISNFNNYYVRKRVQTRGWHCNYFGLGEGSLTFLGEWGRVFIFSIYLFCLVFFFVLRINFSFQTFLAIQLHHTYLHFCLCMCFIMPIVSIANRNTRLILGLIYIRY